jgi:hypothetical protein
MRLQPPVTSSLFGPNILRSILFSNPLSILWRIEPLLGKDLETNNETTAVAMQHASTTIELLSAVARQLQQLDYINGN